MTRPAPKARRSVKKPGDIVFLRYGYQIVTDQGYVPYVPSKHKVEGRS